MRGVRPTRPVHGDLGRLPAGARSIRIRPRSTMRAVAAGWAADNGRTGHRRRPGWPSRAAVRAERWRRGSPSAPPMGRRRRLCSSCCTSRCSTTARRRRRRSSLATPGFDGPRSTQMWQHYLAGNRPRPTPCRLAPPNWPVCASTLITCSELDPLRDEAVDYALRLMWAGVATELHVFPGTCHGFDSLRPGLGNQSAAVRATGRGAEAGVASAGELARDGGVVGVDMCWINHPKESIGQRRVLLCLNRH